MLNHKRYKCEVETFERFVKEPTPYRPRGNDMKLFLNKFVIKYVDHYIDHFICYDFECILKPIGTDVLTPYDQVEKSTIYTNQHIPVSVSICDSLTRQTKHFVADSPKKLLQNMFDYMDSVQEKIHRYNVNKFSRLIKPLLKEDGIGVISGFPLKHDDNADDIEKMISKDHAPFDVVE